MLTQADLVITSTRRKLITNIPVMAISGRARASCVLRRCHFHPSGNTGERTDIRNLLTPFWGIPTVSYLRSRGLFVGRTFCLVEAYGRSSVADVTTWCW